MTIFVRALVEQVDVLADALDVESLYLLPSDRLRIAPWLYRTLSFPPRREGLEGLVFRTVDSQFVIHDGCAFCQLSAGVTTQGLAHFRIFRVFAVANRWILALDKAVVV